ncbi:Translation initiation factor IF-2 [Paenibacillus sp. P1XP2]|nr:Translation initiation factor IF-2 [Paenibacillus sp. P1XP2]
MSKQDSKDKLRVYEYAKSLNMSSKEIITILKRLNIPVNNHMSVMENDSVAKVEQFFRDIKSNAAAKRESGETLTTVNTSSIKNDNRAEKNQGAGRQARANPKNNRKSR